MVAVPRLALAGLLSVVTLTRPAAAHFIWVVADRAPVGESEVALYFGEAPRPGDPDLLSYVEQAQAQLLRSTGEVLPLALAARGAAMVGAAELGDGLVFGTRDLGVVERGGSRSALVYHFKAGPALTGDGWLGANTAEHLPLDVHPRLKSDGELELQVLWLGQPLADAEIVLTPLDAPPEKGTADAVGTFTVARPEPGLFALRVKHVEGSTADGVPRNHYTTLTFAVPAPAPLVSSPGPDYPLAVSSHGAAVSDGVIYVYGGHAGETHAYSTETTTGRFFRWQPNRFGANGWEELPSGTHLQGLGLVAHDGALYRLGGARPRNAPGEAHDLRSVASCAVYRPSSGAWETFRELPAPRSSFDAAVHGSTLVVVGGWELRGAGQEPRWADTALMLDLADPQAEWEELPQPFERRALGCAVVGGKLYVVGGLDQHGDVSPAVEILDLATRQWSSGPELPGGRLNGFTPAVATFADRLLVSPADGRIYGLAPSGTSFEVVGELAEKRFVHRLVPVDGRTLAAIAGASPDGNRRTVELLELRDGAATLLEASAPRGAGARPAAATVQRRCPIMRSDFLDGETHAVGYQGVEVLLCCETCEEKWFAEPEAYLDPAVLPQLAGLALPPRKIEQIYCPVYRDRVVSSLDPSLEHGGRTLYFFSESARKRFTADPAQYPVDESLFR
jgi:YHS domain-containing protein